MMRLVLLLSLSTGGLLLTPAKDSQAADQVQAVLDKAIRAHGGWEKLSAIKAVRIKSKGTGQTGIEANGESDMDFTRETTYQFPEQFREKLTVKIPQFGALHHINLLNRDKASLHLRGFVKQNSVIQGRSLANLKERLHRKDVARLVGLKDSSYTLASLGETKVGDKPAVGVQVKAKGFRDIDLFFDKESGLLVKTRYHEMDEKKGRDVIEEEVVTEYQKVDGVSVPKKIMVNRDGEEGIRDEEFVEIHFPKSLGKEEFAPPS